MIERNIFTREAPYMPKNDNPHVSRLYNSIAKHLDEKTAESIVNKIPLSKSADIDKKFAWAESICADLESKFEADVVKAIRMDCACGPEMGKISKLKKLYDSCAGLDDFAAKANKQNAGFTIDNCNDELFLIYPQCYCSCVKRVNSPISKTWCYCTLGYTKKMFEHVLGREVNVELIESVKTGGNVCKIKIT